MAELSSFSLHPGDVAPSFSLPSTDGRTVKLADYAEKPFLVVTFWCNHCPYVQAWEGRMMDLARSYAPKGVGFVLINSNDETAYPDDSMPKMIERARSKQYPIPYLRDESQEVAHEYGALVTPHPMLFDRTRRLLFQGRIDDSHAEPSRVKERFLAQALDSAIAGRPIARPELAVLGCSVKWKS